MSARILVYQYCDVDRREIDRARNQEGPNAVFLTSKIDSAKSRLGYSGDTDIDVVVSSFAGERGLARQAKERNRDILVVYYSTNGRGSFPADATIWKPHIGSVSSAQLVADLIDEPRLAELVRGKDLAGLKERFPKFSWHR